jgi:hypothetical protein
VLRLEGQADSSIRDVAGRGARTQGAADAPLQGVLRAGTTAGHRLRLGGAVFELDADAAQPEAAPEHLERGAHLADAGVGLSLEPQHVDGARLLLACQFDHNARRRPHVAPQARRGANFPFPARRLRMDTVGYDTDTIRIRLA